MRFYSKYINNVEENLDTLNKCEKDIFGTIYMKDPAKLESDWWICYCDGEIAGFCGITFYPKIQKPAAFLCLSGVYKEYRGFGLQRRFIKIRENFAAKNGYNRVITYTSYDNIPSANNLIRSGYLLYIPPQEWGVRHGLYFERYI